MGPLSSSLIRDWIKAHWTPVLYLFGGLIITVVVGLWLRRRTPVAVPSPVIVEAAQEAAHSQGRAEVYEVQAAAAGSAAEVFEARARDSEVKAQAVKAGAPKPTAERPEDIALEFEGY